MATNKTSYSFGLLNPNQVSGQRLSTGFYSLSARSNVPFARLIGKGIDKTFTWGETVEVPPNMLCTVANASFHAGDLYINGGCDYDNHPARITVPVPFNQLATFADTTWVTGLYPADVRTARKAYFVIDAESSALVGDPRNAVVVGQRFDGSHNTIDQVVALGVAGAGYKTEFNYSVSVVIGQIPLGFMAVQGDQVRPHTLLTTASVYIDENLVYSGENPTAYYTMEY